MLVVVVIFKIVMWPIALNLQNPLYELELINSNVLSYYDMKAITLKFIYVLVLIGDTIFGF